jgi:hypothetical protein
VPRSHISLRVRVGVLSILVFALSDDHLVQCCIVIEVTDSLSLNAYNKEPGDVFLFPIELRGIKR